MAHTPQDYWRSFEPRTPIESLGQLLEFIDDIAQGDRRIVWRGVKHDAWALHSSLYRYAIDKFGAPPPDAKFEGLEAWVVAKAREWSLDRVPSSRSGLELLAWMQHTGSPTRLIDVTQNPLVAAWFACEAHTEDIGGVATPTDGRLFAVGLTDDPLLDDGRHALPWTDANSGNHAQLTGNQTSLWQPPAIDPRIAAQSGAFLLGPLPQKTSGGNWYNSGESNSRYTAAEVRSLTSIPTRAYKRLEPGEIYRRNPLISVRIGADHKDELRARLETVFNLRPLLLFPDPYGLAGHFRRVMPPT